MKWHRIIKNDGNFKTLVLPTWRPDCVLAIEDVKFKDYISKLEEVSKVKINTFSDLKKSLKYRLNLVIYDKIAEYYNIYYENTRIVKQ